MRLFERLESVRERWDVLSHPFYTRWSAGELTREELGYYAGQYRHAVVALAEASAAAAGAADEPARAGLARHAAEETAHVELWDRFAAAFGAAPDAPEREETAACAAAWTGSDDLLEGLVTLYAIESAQPAISRTKLDGLAEHYGVPADSPAAAYFALHAELDHAHAAHARRLIEERLDGADEERLAARAEAALAANWQLLDGVERRFGR